MDDLFGDGSAEAWEGTLNMDAVEARVDPRVEWRQMYREIWRTVRDFFYDPRFHGLDLKAAEKKYEPYLESVGGQADLDYLFRQMLSELSVSHLSVGSRSRGAPFMGVGLLGADFQVEQGRHRFARLYARDTWDPAMRSPLTEPGLNVKAGSIC